MFQGSLNDVPRKILGCFKEVSRVFQESFKGIQRCLKEVQWVVEESIKCVLRMFQLSFISVSRKIEGFSQRPSIVIQGRFMGI